MCTDLKVRGMMSETEASLCSASEQQRQQQEEVEDEDTVCGVGKCKPSWMQRFANPKMYLANFSLLGILDGAFFTCIVGATTTLEKRYAFDSRISGLVIAADSFSQIIFSVLIGYFGGNIHRPRWVAAGMMIAALSCFLFSLPYFIYGPALHLINTDPNAVAKPKYEFCSADGNSDCDESKSSTNLLPVVIFFTANFFCGLGITAFYTVGTPYLDDNVKKKNSPVYLGSIGALRMFGPVVGFFISSLTLQLYEDPFFDPGFSQDDPRWIGAWWLGFVILGTLQALLTIPFFLFPRRMPGAPSRVKENKQEMPKWKDMPKALLKLIKNPIFTLITIASVLHLNGVAGYFVFLPKYIENQFHKTASKANFYTGTISLTSVVIGIMLGGIAVRVLKPKPRRIMAYVIFVHFLTTVGFIATMLLGCSQGEMAGMKAVNDELDPYNDCNADCGCTKRIFEPVCGPDGKSTYFSPCFAGCTGLNDSRSPKVFTNCSCITNGTVETFAPELSGGYCPLDCNMFIPYFIVLCLSKFAFATSTVGYTLIFFRCVPPEDKTFAFGALGGIMSAFGFLPIPLVFGAITDAACLVWEENCGKTGNCWLYDTDKFRYYLHILGITFVFVSNLFHVGIFFLTDRIKNFYEEETQEELPVENSVGDNRLKFRELEKEQSLNDAAAVVGVK